MEQYPLIDTGAVLAVAGPHKGLPAIVVDSPENSLRGIDSAGADHGLVRAGIIAVSSTQNTVTQLWMILTQMR